MGSVDASARDARPAADDHQIDQLLFEFTRLQWLYEQLVKLRPLSGEPLRVLDVSCADVYVSLLDASFNRRYPDTVGRYDCTVLSAGTLEQFADDEFDVVLCCDVLEHVRSSYVPTLLEQINRISRWAFISAPNSHQWQWDSDDLLGLMRDTGLRLMAPGRLGLVCDVETVDAVIGAEPESLTANVGEFLRSRLDEYTYRLVMARFVGSGSQHVLYPLTCAGGGQ